MTSKQKHLRQIGLPIILILVTVTLFNLYSEKREVVNEYLSLSVTLRESCNYAYMQNGVNQRLVENPFKGR